ncbi:hypothetical protein H8959_006234, partial [Pygathrix nigripes]
AGTCPVLYTAVQIMRPDDANVAGNVHGGTILKMIEEAGAIISTRHCNSQNGRLRHGEVVSLHKVTELVSSRAVLLGSASEAAVLAGNAVAMRNPVPVVCWGTCASRAM